MGVEKSPIGYLRLGDIPIEIQTKVVHHIGNYGFPRIIKDGYTPDTKLHELFLFSSSPEGHDFWAAISRGEYEEYFVSYPKDPTKVYKVGTFGHMPKKLKDLARLRVKELNDKLKFNEHSKVSTLFNWDKTKEGFQFWRDVDNGNYKVYDQKYPNGHLEQPQAPERPKYVARAIPSELKEYVKLKVIAEKKASVGHNPFNVGDETWHCLKEWENKSIFCCPENNRYTSNLYKDMFQVIETVTAVKKSNHVLSPYPKDEPYLKLIVNQEPDFSNEPVKCIRDARIERNLLKKGDYTWILKSKWQKSPYGDVVCPENNKYMVDYKKSWFTVLEEVDMTVKTQQGRKLHVMSPIPINSIVYFKLKAVVDCNEFIKKDDVTWLSENNWKVCTTFRPENRVDLGSCNKKDFIIIEKIGPTQDISAVDYASNAEKFFTSRNTTYSKPITYSESSDPKNQVETVKEVSDEVYVKSKSKIII